MSTLLNPDNREVWEKLIQKVNKVYPKAETHLASKDNIHTLTITTKKGSENGLPVIQITLEIKASSEKVVITRRTRDNQKIVDKDSTATSYYFPESTDRTKVDFDRITAYIDKTLDNGLTQVMNKSNRLRNFMTVKEPAKRHRYGHIDGFIDEALVQI